MVISTKSLPFENWKKTRIYASVAEFLYFNKLIQIPFMILNNLEKVSYKKLFEHFINEGKQFPIIKEINENFKDHADQISGGKVNFYLKKGF